MQTTARIVLCSVVAAAVWHALTRVAFALVGGSFLERVVSGPLELDSVPRLVAVNLGPAVWGVLMYWGLEDHYGHSRWNIPKAAAGWWLISTLVHAKWYGFGVIRLPEDYGIVTMIATLLVAAIAIYAGAWLLDRLEPE